MVQNDKKVGYKYFSEDFRSFWDSLTLLLPNDFQKEALLCIWISRSFGLNNFRNIWAMSVLFSTEHGKFNVDRKNGKKNRENIYGFSENLISIGKCKFCKILRKYSLFAVNVLSNRPKILDLIKNKFFWLNLVQNDKKVG